MNTKFDIDLTNKVVVITGAGGVICGAIARELAASAAKIALLDLNKPAADLVADDINASGGCAVAYECNVLDKQSIQTVHDKIVSELGLCDILINGARGLFPPAPLISRSTFPNISFTCRFACFMLSLSRQLQYTAAAFGPISSATLRAADSLMSRSATFAPHSASALANSPQITPPAPVIAATFPPRSALNGTICFFLLFYRFE